MIGNFRYTGMKYEFVNPRSLDERKIHLCCWLCSSGQATSGPPSSCSWTPAVWYALWWWTTTMWRCPISTETSYTPRGWRELASIGPHVKLWGPSTPLYWWGSWQIPLPGKMLWRYWSVITVWWVPAIIPACSTQQRLHSAGEGDKDGGNDQRRQKKGRG